MDANVFVLACIDARDLGEHLDGIPVSLMEAMAMGIPVVSTNLSGIPELIENDVSGLLVPEKNARELAEALRKFIGDKQLSLEMGRNARRRIEDHFDLSVNTRLLVPLLEDFGIQAKTDREVSIAGRDRL